MLLFVTDPVNSWQCLGMENTTAKRSSIIIVIKSTLGLMPIRALLRKLYNYLCRHEKLQGHSVLFRSDLKHRLVRPTKIH